MSDVVDGLGRVDADQYVLCAVVVDQRRGCRCVDVDAVPGDRIDIVDATFRERAAASASEQFGVLDVEPDGGFRCTAKLRRVGREFERLRDVSRESVKDVPAAGQRRFQRCPEDLEHQLIRYQIARGQVSGDLLAQCGPRRDLLAQDLTGGQVRDAEPGRDEAALGALARSRWADQQDVHTGAFRRSPDGNCEDRKMRPYDAVLLVSFGGPEGPDDVMPFLENVTAGRGVPRERLLDVAEHYHHVGGASPINGQNRALLAALRDDFDEHGIALPLYWGNRHWTPTLPEVLARMRDDGVTNAIAFLTSAYASFSSCRQYLDAIERARAEVGDGAPTVDRLRQYFNHPGFIEPMIRGVEAALQELPAEYRDEAALAFVAHSIPSAMEATSGPAGGAYGAQLAEAIRLVTAGVGGAHSTTLSFCSRSGSPSVPWLEPDIGDRLTELAKEGARAVVVVPIGFVSDHMEVVYDLDTEAAETAAELGLTFVRSATVGIAPPFVSMVRELVLERMGEAPARSLGSLGPALDVCPADCCRPRVEAGVSHGR